MTAPTVCNVEWPNVAVPEHPHRCTIRAGWHVNHCCHCGTVRRVSDDEHVEMARRSAREGTDPHA